MPTEQGWCLCLFLSPFATEDPSGFPPEQSASPPRCVGCSSMHGWPSKGHFESLRRRVLQAVMFLASNKVLRAVRFLARNIFRFPCLLPYLLAWFCCIFRSSKEPVCPASSKEWSWKHSSLSMFTSSHKVKGCRLLGSC